MQTDMNTLQSELAYLHEQNHQMAQKALQSETATSQVCPPTKRAPDTHARSFDTLGHGGGAPDSDSTWTIRAVRTSGSGRSCASSYTDNRLVLPPIDEEGPQSCGAYDVGHGGDAPCGAEVCNAPAFGVHAPRCVRNLTWRSA